MSDEGVISGDLKVITLLVYANWGIPKGKKKTAQGGGAKNDDALKCFGNCKRQAENRRIYALAGFDDDSKGKASLDRCDNDSDIIPFIAVLVKDN